MPQKTPSVLAISNEAWRRSHRSGRHGRCISLRHRRCGPRRLWLSPRRNAGLADPKMKARLADLGGIVLALPACRIRKAHRRRNREVGQGDPRGQHQAGIIVRPGCAFHKSRSANRGCLPQDARADKDKLAGRSRLRRPAGHAAPGTQTRKNGRTYSYRPRACCRWRQLWLGYCRPGRLLAPSLKPRTTSSRPISPNRVRGVRTAKEKFRAARMQDCRTCFVLHPCWSAAQRRPVAFEVPRQCGKACRGNRAVSDTKSARKPPYRVSLTSENGFNANHGRDGANRGVSGSCPRGR